MKNVMLVRYGEIALRGNNRGLYEKKLIYNIRKNLKRYGSFWIQKEQGRFLIETAEDLDYDYFIPNIVNVFGVVGICPCIKAEGQDIETLREIALAHMLKLYGDKHISFKVETKRANKKYPVQSTEVSALVGGYILEHMPNLKVDVHNPDIILKIELRNHAYIYSEMIKGFGGLPVGSSGKGTLLISGGIDSPVAGFLTAKRGVEIEAVYFHSHPYTSNRAKEKAKDLAERLAFYTGGIKLYIVNFTDVQLELKENVPPEKLTTLLKRSMLKAGEKIASANRSMALITGDSIGQVASQTMESIFAIDSAVSFPILRPLAAMDKNEIIEIARKIGTYDISIRPYEDCCTIFVADHPETKPRRHIIESIESHVENLENLIEQAVDGAEIIEF